jgi:hypothetical protein
VGADCPEAGMMTAVERARARLSCDRSERRIVGRRGASGGGGEKPAHAHNHPKPQHEAPRFTDRKTEGASRRCNQEGLELIGSLDLMDGVNKHFIGPARVFGEARVSGLGLTTIA